MPVNPMPLTIGEVLQRVKDARSKEERVAILKENDGFALRHFLRLAFDPSIVMSLQPGRPLFTPNPKPIGFGETTIKAAIKGWYVFFAKSTPNLRQTKRDLLFINLLEHLDRQEAEFLVQAKEKNLDVGLTKKVIDEVFPGLLSGDLEISVPQTEGSGDETSAQDNS